MASVSDYLGQAEILTATAEEAAELAQAALKLRRAITGISPTPVTEDEAVRRLQEEIGDLFCCLYEILCIDWAQVNAVIEQKRTRWLERLGVWA